MGPNPQAVALPADIFLTGMVFAGAGAMAVLVLFALVAWLLRRVAWLRRQCGEYPEW